MDAYKADGLFLQNTTSQSRSLTFCRLQGIPFEKILVLHNDDVSSLAHNLRWAAHNWVARNPQHLAFSLGQAERCRWKFDVDPFFYLR